MILWAGAILLLVKDFRRSADCLHRIHADHRVMNELYDIAGRGNIAFG